MFKYDFYDELPKKFFFDDKYFFDQKFPETLEIRENLLFEIEKYGQTTLTLTLTLILTLTLTLMST